MDLVSTILLRNEGSLCSQQGEVLLERVVFAVSFRKRFLGLMGKKEEEAENLLLYPCASIHTCFMKFPLDVLFLTREGKVTDLFRNLKPWIFYIHSPGAVLCIETRSGRIPQAIKKDDILFIKSKED